MNIKIFGKDGCKFCKTTIEKFETFLKRWNIDKQKVSLDYYNMDSVDGLAEGAFYSVGKIPTTVIEKDGETLIRWDGKVPLSSEFKDLFAVEKQVA